MSDIVRILRNTPYRRPQPADRNPFRLIPGTRLEARQEAPEVIIEGVPPIQQKRQMARNET